LLLWQEWRFNMPAFYMLIGVPASGKSTWIKTHSDGSAMVLSTDNKIEAAARSQGKTYSEVFKDEIKAANTGMAQDLLRALRDGRDIIWDQTNITRKSRKEKLARIPSSYKKIAVFFPTPLNLKKRLASRPGKEIPEPVILSMINQLEPPSKNEGFDEIIIM
jgi:predicted kinase